MTDKRAILIATVADRAVAEALASTFPGGAGSFGPGAVRLSTNPAATVDTPTHICISGAMPEEMVEAFRISSVPFFMVVDNPEDRYAGLLLNALQPPLYFCIDNQEV